MIEICYTNGEKIIIKLFDNIISKKLIDCYGDYYKDSYSVLDCSIDSNQPDYLGASAHKEELDSHWSLILEGLDGMRNLGNEVNIQFPNEFDFSQETLNTLHRIFTYVDLYHSDQISDYTYCDNYSKDVGISWEEYHSIVDKINMGVHNLESWAKPTDNRSYLSTNHPLSRILYQLGQYSTFQKKWCEFNDEEYKENFNFLNYDVDNIVTLTDTILGKSPLASFRDDDNPILPDCTGRFATDGSFQINKGRQLQDFYNSEYFNNWTNKFERTKNSLPLEFAIGYVYESTKDLDYFFNFDLKIESIIWKYV